MSVALLESVLHYCVHSLWPKIERACTAYALAHTHTYTHARARTHTLNIVTTTATTTVNVNFNACMLTNAQTYYLLVAGTQVQVVKEYLHLIVKEKEKH